MLNASKTKNKLLAGVDLASKAVDGEDAEACDQPDCCQRRSKTSNANPATLRVDAMSVDEVRPLAETNDAI